MTPIPIGPGDFGYALALTGLFAGLFLVFSFLLNLVLVPWRRRRQVARRVLEERLTQLARSGMFRSDFASPKSIILKILERVFNPGTLHNLQRSLFQADIYCGLPRFLNIVIICACFGFIAGWYLRSFWLQLALGFGGVYLPFLYLRFRKGHKARLIEQQMPDAMEMLARTLRAGHTLSSAVDLAAQEISHPLGSELRLASEEQRLGLSMPESLEHMAQRTTSQDLRYFVVAVNIQSEVGGNLSEVMENIGSLIRERLNLKGRIKSLTSQVRMSANIVTIMPFVLFFILYWINPKYTGVLLTDPKGQKLLFVGLVSIALGSIILRRMGNFKV